MEERMDQVRLMAWVDEFYVKLLRVPPMEASEFALCHPDGKRHYWVWFAKVGKEEYGEMEEVHVRGPDPSKVVLHWVVSRMCMTLSELEPK